ncbi:putative membrane protein [Candidatus Protofrankia californiensis]|uniref:Putative membrane protein n=1 Tax=Candidatus Protofrankia californiensis TaxID=1839754 RepID=A0A1C3P044_9ACTN|nr:putative membrane protein [Candidatus Protofrankia californiensis]
MGAVDVLDLYPEQSWTRVVLLIAVLVVRRGSVKASMRID